MKELEIRQVLICRPNHRLGNLLLITPLIQEVISTFPGCKIDLLIKGETGPALFKYYENIDRIIQLPSKPVKYLLESVFGWLSVRKRSYDLVINAVFNSSSGRLATKFAKGRIKIFGDEIMAENVEHDQHIARFPVQNFRYAISKIGYDSNTGHVPLMDLKLSPIEIASGKEVLEKMVSTDKKTIAIYTYATSKKCYSKPWWQMFYERLKSEHPDANILEVLPLNNVSSIDFIAPAYYSRDLREMASVIANAHVFISADCGIMHLSSAAHSPTIGLFNITNKMVYSPYGNSSCSVNTGGESLDQVFALLKDLMAKPAKATGPSFPAEKAPLTHAS